MYIRKTGGTYVTRELVEGPEGRSSCAKSFSHILGVATDVCSNHGYLVHASETENARDGVPPVFPQTEVVSQPLANMFASTSKRRTGDNEWS